MNDAWIPSTRPTFEWHVESCIPSTNGLARQIISGQSEIPYPSAHPLIIWAREQTHGRGTHGRVWSSPAGAGLYVTLVHTVENTPQLFQPVQTQFTQAAGVATLCWLEKTWGPFEDPITLKPVNDVMWQGHKLGGILVESILDGQGKIKALMTGIGLNILEVDHPTDTLDGRHCPVALETILGGDPFAKVHNIPPQGLIEEWMGEVHGWYVQLWGGNTQRVMAAWQDAMECARDESIY